ncbi:MAG: ABC transporter permease, partial [Myxococcota bacterium]|nr:ABC transporter permease [Myxococcota bacterium]
MLSFLLRRMLSGMVVLLGVSTLVFAVLRIVPGDPVQSMLGEHASEADLASLRACFHLDEPLSSQYTAFLGELADGSMGHLCQQPEVTVASKLWAAFWPTLELGIASLLVAILIAFPLGAWSAVRANTYIDHAARVLSLLGISVPSFWLGPMLLIVFALSLRIFPDPGGAAVGLVSLVLPAITLGSALSGKLMRMLRSSMLDALHAQHVQTARAKGLGPLAVTLRHVMRNAASAVLSLLGMQLGAVLAGAIVVEKVFARPGLGTLMLDGIEMRNYQLVQGCVLFVAVLYVLVNLATD